MLTTPTAGSCGSVAGGVEILQSILLYVSAWSPDPLLELCSRFNFFSDFKNVLHFLFLLFVTINRCYSGCSERLDVFEDR